METPSQETIGKLVAGSALTFAATWLYRVARLWLLERRKVTADAHLTDSQAGVQAATAVKIRAEAEGNLLDRMERYCNRIEERLKAEHLRVMELQAELKAERERAEARERLYESQLERVKVLLKANDLEFPS